ncbi:MAG: type II toxin-antitoxin system VapC family toxin [Gemmatimonadetes bacterium]|nr:type II toxin-antitoxin system VapC family toxin [Gemmatimonadota bacterium]MXY81552.1 type II toxin-antitoxin system VapC family toxin [Gemmatimonadota bacterium]MYB68885.1 type II toxin-antitoxin system VapC family toxin [Gemmatimonadota bacterium]
MCAIVDANVVSEIFGSNLPPAGEKFFDWLNQGSGRLVVGGKLLEELKKSSADFRHWGREAQLAGKMTIINKSEVDARTKQLQSAAAIRSNDPHVIALAQVSGARLLYSNDGNLQKDFNNKSLIDAPRGKVYSTSVNKSFQPRHDRLLKSKKLCRL